MTPTREKAQMVRKGLVLGAILAALFGVLPTASAQEARGAGKLSGEVVQKVRAAAPDDLIPVIIETTDTPSSAHFARLHGRGGVIKAIHSSILGYSASVPASQIEGLADDPEVGHVSYDSPVRAHMDVAYPAVKADVAFANSGGLDGAGVGVAIIDTGVYAHDDLMRTASQAQVLEVEVVGHEPGIADYFGHGTHVAGIIVGNGADSTGGAYYRTFRGLAPGARLISLRALYPDGSGYTSDILTALDWVIKFRTVYDIRVLNLSLGHPVYESYTTDPLCMAVRAATNAGIVVVAAAGNDGAVGTGFGTIDSPANEPSVITVGAMDDRNSVSTTDDVLAPYSSKGPTLIDHVVKPDLVAPGTHIVSLRAVGSYLDTQYHDWTLALSQYRYGEGNKSDGVYYDLSGTSMAAPMVAGTAVLMIQKDSTLSPATVKARLMASAVKDAALVFETGAGYLNVDAALKATGLATSALSPTAMLASDGGVYVQSLSLIWGGSWNDSLIWGLSKGASYGIVSTSVPPSVTESYGLIWGFNAGTGTFVQNTQVTASGLIWGVDCSSLIWGSALDTLGSIWGGDRH
jgi:serine protease AprX